MPLLALKRRTYFIKIYIDKCNNNNVKYIDKINDIKGVFIYGKIKNES